MRAAAPLLAGVLIASACAGAGARDRGTPPLVTTLSEARSAVGKLVRVRGTAQREKMGDAIDAPGLNVVCPDWRLPDQDLGQQVTVEGRLELTSEGAAVVGPGGEISQGTEPGLSYWVLRGCVRRP
ncbi:MAG: hypothetical protein RMK29_13395 [Myxococcales bacterium]|nr:hypothetical protein [Myxococcota bacterium]MDW8282702.1 hypothetical protein [Myxococcales bacterium]